MNPAVIRYLEISARMGLISVVYILLVLAMLPVIGWWGGLAAGILWAAFYGMQIRFEAQSNLLNHLMKVSLLAVFFGLFLHGGCRVYSSWKLAILEDECNVVKENVLNK